MATKLVLAVKGVYFDAVADGSKSEEFRLVTPYWTRRLKDRWFSSVELTKGYPSRDDHERRLLREWRGYRRTTITHPHFGPDPVEVYAIDVSEPLPSPPVQGGE